MMYWTSIEDNTPNLAKEVKILKDTPKYGFGFKRPTELPKSSGGSKTPSLWGTKGILPLAIDQGSIGDCWFLSSASAIAETPSRI